MKINIKNLLDKLDIKKDSGRYENNFYIIDLADSDEYSRVYTLLSDNAINTEYPNFGTNSNNSTIKITNYFEIECNDISYNIFLIANFEEDKYYIRIGEK